MVKKKDGPALVVPGDRRKKIVVVDDHPLVSQGLTVLIEREPDLVVVATANSVAETQAALERHPADLVLLDISLAGGGNGIELLKDLQVRHPQLNVLMLSMHEECVYAERALRAGAKGYIMKSEPGDKVVSAIRCVLDGGLYVSPAIASRMLRIFVSNKTGDESRSPVEKLSDRELQVLTLIGGGMPSRLIAEKLHLSVKTIQTYREHIKRKLSLNSSAELAHYATHWVEFERV
jgi:DNA-binding NarL/FixJ family response regulator